MVGVVNWVRIFTEGRWKRAALVLPVLFALWLVLTVDHPMG